MKSNVNVRFSKVSLATIGVCVFCASASVGALFIFRRIKYWYLKKQYEMELIYQPFFDASTPESKQYTLIVKKVTDEYTNCYGQTLSSALAYQNKWIKKENYDY